MLPARHAALLVRPRHGNRAPTTQPSAPPPPLVRAHVAMPSTSTQPYGSNGGGGIDGEIYKAVNTSGEPPALAARRYATLSSGTYDGSGLYSPRGTVAAVVLGGAETDSRWPWVDKW
jgi:hypothetical protein